MPPRESSQKLPQTPLGVDVARVGAIGGAVGGGTVAGGDHDAVVEEGSGGGEGHEALEDLVGGDLDFGEGAVAEGAGFGKGEELGGVAVDFGEDVGHVGGVVFDHV